MAPAPAESFSGVADLDEDLFDNGPTESAHEVPPPQGHAEIAALKTPVLPAEAAPFLGSATESIATTPPAASEPSAAVPSLPRPAARPMPRPAANDPLAALKAMSDEERIALFT